MNNKFWNEKYSHESYFYGEHPNEFLVEEIRHIPKEGRVLCLCEGEGRNAVYLAKNGFNVTAIDFSEEAKNKAIRLAIRHNVSINYQLLDLAEYDFELNKWDAIISIFAHLPSPLRKNVYPKLVSSLSESGVLILEAYTTEQIRYGTGGPKEIEMLCTEKILKDEIGGLNWISLTEGEKHLQEGIGHSGASYTIRGTARKSVK
jgi:2-polyprenyl-3-methyl-5-hydroxy-6-metoxy-1,4-benzoquinol methylase